MKYLVLLVLALSPASAAQGTPTAGQGDRGRETPRPAQPTPPEEKAPPTPEQARAAVAALEKALAEADVEAQLAGIRQALAVPCGDVAKALDKAAAKGSPETRRAVVAALGRLEDPLARTLLARRMGAAGFAKEETAFAVEVVRALGRRGDESSIATLASGPLRKDQEELGRARILALGNIHHPKSVEALLELSVKAGPAQLQPFAEELRLALRRLTRQDFGMEALAWQRWWRDGGKSQGLPTAPAELGRMDALRWRLFWDADPLAERERRGDGEGRPPREERPSREGRPQRKGEGAGEDTPPSQGT